MAPSQVVSWGPAWGWGSVRVRGLGALGVVILESVNVVLCRPAWKANSPKRMDDLPQSFLYF